jgi:lipopolysaccharide export system permease protein
MSPVPKLTERSESSVVKRELFDELTSLPVMKPKYLSISEIRRIGEVMKKQNLSASKYDMQLYKIYAHSLSVIVIIITIFPLCVGFNRNQSYIAVAAKSILTGFGYWMLMASCYSLGKTGILTPFFANFLPIFLFIGLSGVLIYRRERGL